MILSLRAKEDKLRTNKLRLWWSKKISVFHKCLRSKPSNLLVKHKLIIYEHTEIKWKLKIITCDQIFFPCSIWFLCWLKHFVYLFQEIFNTYFFIAFIKIFKIKIKVSESKNSIYVSGGQHLLNMFPGLSMRLYLSIV